ncbi:MAG: metallopeptidase family protein [Candidatus Chisholmbacteria bacterium]|nr:metallopeptidase family protein [Candidatus Chisholmbacteria bacterium]
MTRTEFEKLVAAAVDNLPKEFREKLDNVDIVVADWPSRHVLNVTGIGERGLLFGLYQGVPQPQRTSSLRLPDKITIFAGPILLVSHSPAEIKTRVTQVVKHEIGHHFGLSDSHLRRRGY